MGEVRGFGLTHYPRLYGPDEDMNSILRRDLKDPAIPANEKDPANWPPKMREEWTDPVASASQHRTDLIQGMDAIRKGIDDFDPDVVIMWGDDQYELFREEVIPPFCALAFEEMVIRPWVGRSRNIWHESDEKELRVKMDPDIARYFVGEVMKEGIDLAYSYKMREGGTFPHAFLYPLVYLDYHRNNPFNYTLLPISVNCYGKRVISNKGRSAFLGTERVDDPPSPSPSRCMEFGAAVARVAERSPYRVAVVASSGWSHAPLNDKAWHLHPDVDADRRLYTALVEQDYEVWRKYDSEELERAGQQEVLNWFCLLGAMEALGQSLVFSSFLEVYTFNSTKVFAMYE